MSKHSILVVEDEALLAANLVDTLSSLGYTVHEAVARGEDAISSVTEKKPDLVLMDIKLLGPMNGIEAAEKIRAIANIPILYLTSHTDDLHLKQAQLTDPYGYIVKPANSRELKATIEMALYKHALDRKLKESEELFRTLIEASPDAIVLSDLEGNVLMQNRQAELLVGYDDTDRQTGTNVLNFFPEEELERLAENTKKTLEQGSIHDVEYTLIKKDGTRIPVELNASVVKDPAGGQQRFVTVLRDITGRKRSEAAIRASEEKYRLIADNTADNIWIFDMDMHLRYISPSVEKMKGFTVEESMSQSLDEMMTPASLESLMKRFRQEMVLEASGTADPHRTVSFETEEYCKSGATIFVENSVTLLRDAHGHPVGMQGISRDITDRKRMEEALEESEMKYRNLAETTQDFIITTDFEGVITYANPVARNLFGERGLVGVVLNDFMKEEQLAWHLKMLNARREGLSEVLSFEWQFESPEDGSPLLLDVRSSLLMDKGSPSGILFNARDITEREQMVDALRKREHDFTTLVENATDMIARFDTDLRYMYFNPVVERQLGIPLHRLLGKTALESGIYEDQSPFIDASLRSTLETGREQEVKQSFPTPQGMRHFQTRIIPERDPDGSIVSLLAITRDISERKKSEEALQESERRLSDIIDFLPDATFVINKDGCVIAWNRAIEQMTGVSKADILGKCDYAYAVPFYGTNIPILINTLISDAEIDSRYKNIRSNGDTITAEVFVPSMRNGNGAYIWATASRLNDRNGELTGAIESIRDVTDKHQAETALLKSEEQYRNVVEDQTEYICRFLPDGTHIFVNEAYCRYFDRKPEEIIGHRFRPVIHPKDREIVARHLASLNPDHPVINIDQRIIMPDGSTRWQRWSDRAIFDPEGRVIEYQSVGRDITEQKELEKKLEYHVQELQKFSTSLEAANKKLNLLSGITRHDITNQLTVMLGYLRVLEKKQPDNSFSEHFKKIKTAAQRISSMLQFTKDYEKIGLNAPIWQDCLTLVDIAAMQAQLGQVMVRKDLPPGTEVFADPLVVKVFYNLMDNAVRYGGKITTISFSAVEQNGNHTIICEDDGEGVVAEEKEKIFERGFGRNTGLGLALSREILSITGITIRETGEPGKGARFEMTVPKGAWRMAGDGI